MNTKNGSIQSGARHNGQAHRFLNEQEMQVLDGIQAQEAVANAMDGWLKAAKSGWTLVRSHAGDDEDRRGHDLFLKGPEPGQLYSLDITLKPEQVKDGWNVVHVRREMFERGADGKLKFIDIGKFRMELMQELAEVMQASRSVKLASR